MDLKVVGSNPDEDPSGGEKNCVKANARTLE